MRGIRTISKIHQRQTFFDTLQKYSQRFYSIYSMICIKNMKKEILVPAKEIAQNKSAWATKIVLNFFGANRMDSIWEAYHFSYIKFAKRSFYCSRKPA